MKTFVRSVMFVSILVTTAASALAQTDNTFPTRVSVTAPAPILVLPDAKLVPLRTAAAGTVLNVQRVDGDWYRVEFQDPQYGRRVGYIERRYVADQQAALDLTVPDDAPPPAYAPAPQPTFAPSAFAKQPYTPPQAQPSAFAQHAGDGEGLKIPAFETSFGWQYARIGENRIPMGWDMSVAGSVTPWFSVVGEVTGNYKDDGAYYRAYSAGCRCYYDQYASYNYMSHAFLSGPRFVGRLAGGHVNPFGQFLVGTEASYVQVNLLGFANYGTQYVWALQPGGGVDIALGDSVAIRMQVDRRTPVGDISTWRFTPGVVIRTGGHTKVD